MSRIDKPITFAEADKALARRQDRETYLKSREIAAQWSAEARSRAFFSARVANATILSELHSKAQAIAQGKMTQQQAKLLLRRYFVGEGAKPLAALGFAPADEAGGVGELGSAQRIIYKYGIWRVGWSKEHRPEHLARDGRAYAFDHPIWTESPPGGEFNCHCYRQLARESEVLEKGITPEPQASYFEPSSLGFDPSRGMREPPEFGKRVRKLLVDAAAIVDILVTEFYNGRQKIYFICGAARRRQRGDQGLARDRQERRAHGCCGVQALAGQCRSKQR